MSKENENATQPTPSVLCAAMQYLKATADLSNFRTLDQDVHLIIEYLLFTDFFEDKELREKVSLLLQHTKALTSAFKDVSDAEIIVSCNNVDNDSRS
ncbi:hypothetical protein Q2490_16840 [Myroides odoratimimus]|uniref:hypothetical protein n=1 Tax=Myroides odoratimimus TaxID=76832 RepID=UPI0026E0B50B|nr:hypothetical protein [Myroides odoratimimus]MDO5858945.1 hypothetical protein [Myroides odoratimimus]